MEAPVSDPRAAKHNPAATAAPGPLEEPPLTRSVFHGFRTAPKCALMPSVPTANSDMPRRPSVTAPAASRRCRAVAVVSAIQPWRMREPQVVSLPAR